MTDLRWCSRRFATVFEEARSSFKMLEQFACMAFEDGTYS
jgi:hypothetical protein